MKRARTLALGAAVVAALSLVTPAMAAHAETSPLPVVAADTPQPVVATDTTPAPGARPVTLIGVDPDIVNGLTVTGHQGRTIKATAKGQRTRTVTAAASTPAVLKSLTPGVAYTITIGGKTVANATPVAGVGPATNLIVRITPTPGQVHLTWSHTPRRVEGVNVSYAIAATPQGTGPATVEPVQLEATDTEARFTKVEAQRGGPSHDTSDNGANVLSPQTMLLVLALAMLVGAAGVGAAGAIAVPAISLRVLLIVAVVARPVLAVFRGVTVIV